MRNGFSLVELCLVLAALGLLLLIASPAFGGLHDRLAVEDAAQALVGAHARARLVALAEQRTVVLTLTTDSLVVRSVLSPTDTLERWRSGPPGPTVQLAGLPRQIVYAPSGATMGFANGTYTITRGAAQRLVIVSRYGRVRVQ